VTTPSTTAPKADATSAGALSPAALLSAFCRGGALVLALLAVVWALGLVPAEMHGWVVLGSGAAVMATGLAVLLHGRFLDARAAASLRGDPRLLAGRLQSLMAAALGIKLAVVTLGVLSLRAMGLKFELVAAFAVAFAAASLVCQVTAAGTLVRAMSRCKRAAQAGGVDRPTGGPS
jgi:hypothetical protein